MHLKTSQFFDLTDFTHASLFEDIYNPWEALNHLEAYIRNLSSSKKNCTISPHAYLINPAEIYIGEGSIIEAGAYVQGPCSIGNNCVVRHGAYIRGNLLTGDHVIIGHDTEVKNSIFLPGSHAAHFAYVGDSIIGRQVNLGAGTKCANYKLDKQTIAVEYEGSRIETKRRKLGAIIGDNCQIGCNSVLNPGTLMGKDVRCYPCVNIGGWIPSKSLIKSAQKAVIVPLRKDDE